MDSDVIVDGTSATVRAAGAEAKIMVPAIFYTVDGYAPFSAQMLMLRYWKQHGEPRVIRTVPGSPGNDVYVESRWTIKDGKVYDAPTLWRSVRFQP